MKYFVAKAATNAAHLILDHGNDEGFKAFVNAVLVSDNPKNTEMYWFLLKLFTKSNMDGLVNREFLSKPTNMDVSIPRMYKYAPIKTEMYKTEDEKEQAKEKMFDYMDFKGIDVVNVDEWLKFCVEYPIAKTANLATHLILNHGNDEELKAFANAVKQNDTNQNDLKGPDEITIAKRECPSTCRSPDNN